MGNNKKNLVSGFETTTKRWEQKLLHRELTNYIKKM